MKREKKMSDINSLKTRKIIHVVEMSQFITFTVQDQEYAVDIMSVKEIKGWTDTTALPNTPAYVRGVINLRGGCCSYS
jgi:chemotaxis signal transduction protein